jgi:ATP adenylyltransferase
MTHEELLDFIRNRMRMSHIYQPVMLRVLLESSGSATERQIAEAISSEDPSQVAFVRNARTERGRVTANEGSCDVNLRASPAISARREQQQRC